MKSLYFFLLPILLFVSAHTPEIIEENTFGEIHLGITTIKEVKKLYPDSKSEKLDYYAMFRTDNGRFCRHLVKETITVKRMGIVFEFQYDAGDLEDSIKIYGVNLYSPFKGKTKNNVGINSTIKEVVDVYGGRDKLSDFTKYLDYDWIEFGFGKDRRVNKISLNFIN